MRRELAVLLLGAMGCAGPPSADTKADTKKEAVPPRASRPADPAAVQKLKDAGKELTPAAFLETVESGYNAKRAELVALYLAAGMDPNAKGSGGDAALNVAASQMAKGSDQRAVLDMLLKAGADVRARGSQNRTPLHSAAIQGDLAIVDALLAAGAEVDARSEGGYTPLYIASQNGHVAVMKRLLEKGADVNARNTLTEQTPLMAAAYNAGPEAIEVLAAAKADLNAVDYSKRSALDMAVDLERPEEVVAALRKAGAQSAKKKE
jgi:ankyrin repeat protein